MSDNSSIEWTDATWNPVRGCDKVSPGCKHCYAETFAERWRGIKGHPFEQGFDLRLVPEALDKPLRWKKPRKIFVNSMSDLFHEGVSNEYIAAVFGVMAACPQHTFQVLTKRADRLPKWFEWAENHDQVGGGIHACITEMFGVPRLNEYLTRNDSHEGSDPGEWDHLIEDPPDWPLPNVHLGVSCEDQQRADERVHHLLRTPAAVRWVSAEPLLGPIDGAKFIRPRAIVDGYRQASAGVTGPVPAHLAAPGIDWLVAGGESGPSARPCNLAWIRSIVEQCEAARLPAFVKQLGAHPLHDPNDGNEWRRASPILKLSDRKGGDPDEWPPGNWPRQFPGSTP